MTKAGGGGGDLEWVGDAAKTTEFGIVRADVIRDQGHIDVFVLTARVLKRTRARQAQHRH